MHVVIYIFLLMVIVVIVLIIGVVVYIHFIVVQNSACNIIQVMRKPDNPCGKQTNAWPMEPTLDGQTATPRPQAKKRARKKENIHTQTNAKPYARKRSGCACTFFPVFDRCPFRPVVVTAPDAAASAVRILIPVFVPIVARLPAAVGAIAL